MEAITIEDLRLRARRRLPRAIFDFVDGGAMDERTLAANQADFAALGFRPRVLVDVAARRQGVRVLGQEFTTPLILAPIGLTEFFGPGGEIAAARAAAKAGAGFCLSTMATTTIEDLAGGAPGFWFQLYFQRDRGVTRALVERAAAAGCPVLCLTVDLAVQGRRERDERNGFTVPPRITARNALDFALHPRWLWRLNQYRAQAFANFAGFAGHQPDFTTVARYIVEQFEPALTWQDVDWLKSIWPGHLVIKGILSPEDARLAADHGADGIVVSNHGGRQLDGAVSTIAALPEIVNAAGKSLDILIDGGIRRGGDVVKALALGARACLIGRPFLYGLAAGGEAGVARALTILSGEIDNVQALIGCPDVTGLDRSFLYPLKHPQKS
jgi:L-lactate dehydrogenase (cytochrome)